MNCYCIAAMEGLSGLLGLALLADQRLVDMGDHTASSNGGLDEGVQLLVTTDGELQMAGGDTLHLEILTGISCQLQHLSCEILENSGTVHSGSSTDAAMAG